MSARIAASALCASRRVVLRDTANESRSDWRRERVWFSCWTLSSRVIDGVGTEEAASPEVDADSVGEAVGDGDGDGVESGGVVRDLGILVVDVSEVDTTKGVAVDPFALLFWSRALKLGLVRSSAG